MIRHLPVAPFDPLHSDLICQLHGRAHSPERGHVGAADALEALRAQLRFVPAGGDYGVPQPGDLLVSNIQKPTALRRLQPLVRAGGVHVASQLVYVQPHHSHNVRAVHRRENPLRTRQRAEFLGRQNHARNRGDVAEKQHARPRRDRIIDKIQRRRRIRHRLWQRDLFHHNPISFRAQVPGMLASRVLLVGHQHFVASLHVQPVRDIAVCFRRIAHQRQLIARAPDKLRERIAKFVPGAVTPDRIVFRIVLRHLFRIVVAIKNRAQHRHGRRSHRPVVEINFIRRNQELFAPFAPIRFFVRTIKRTVRQFRRFLFEERVPLGRQAERSGGAGNACKRRQEATAIDHDSLHKASCADSTREARPSQPAFDAPRLAAARRSVYLGAAPLRVERSIDMRFSKWIVATIFTFSICNSGHLFAQEKRNTKPAVKTRSKEAAKAKTGSPLDSVIDALYAAHTFEQTAIAPDGKRVAWVDTLVGKDGAPDGNTAIYVSDRESSAAPKRVTAAALNVSRAEGSLDWSPDSQQILFLSDAVKPGQLQLYVVSASGGPANKLMTAKGLLAAPRWSPDGKTIAVLYTENATRAAGPLVAETPQTGEIQDAL